LKQTPSPDGSLGLSAEPAARQTPLDLYDSRQQSFRAEADRQRARRDRLSTARLLVFLAFSGAAYLAFTKGIAEWIWWWVPAVALGVGFIQLVRLQRAAEMARLRAADLARLNREAGARVGRAWALLPSAEYPDGSAPPVARDLGLFGQGSLFQLLGTARTPTGKRTLARWLLEPVPAEEVGARQSAVRELAPMLDPRQEQEREGMRAGASDAAIERFLAWAEEPELFSANSPLVLLGRGFSGLMVVLGLGYAIGTLPPLWIPLISVNALIWIASARRITAELEGLELRADTLAGYEALFALIEGSRFRSDRLAGHRKVLMAGGGRGASERLRRLRRIAGMAEVRYSPMLYIPLQLFFLWDTHVLHAMDRWRRESGARVRDWLGAVGDVESLSALGGVAFDNPDWVMPDIDSAAAHWEADLLAHPLLPADERIANDVRLGPPGRFLLVTGSNMSGKSTLLRAIGVNVTLAHAGGPVCAARFAIPPTRLGTSFVIEDSLQSGVSYFMAELQRLKAIVEQAAAVGAEDDWRYIFLLDEILKGTNSGERQIAVRRILSVLLASGAAGAISSHDLALADLPALRERSVPVHFREHYERHNGAPRMAFDYVLREGIATTSNALALLEMMGIDDRA